MMKNVKLVILIIVTISLTSYSLMFGTTASPEKRTFKRVIEVPNRSKNSLFVSANSWFVDTFDYAGSVIEFTDKEEGRIIGKYVFNTFQGVQNFIVRQTITVDVKDSKVRLTISNPYYKWIGDDITGNEDNPSEVFEPLVTEDGLEIARREWEKLAYSLANYVRKDSDW